MFHARGQFLTDVTAFGEGDGVKFIQPGIKREDLVAAKIAAFRHAQAETRGMIDRRARQFRRHFSGGADAARAQRRQTRIGKGDSAFGGSSGEPGIDAELRPQCDLDLGAQTIEFQFAHQRLGTGGRTIQQHGAVAFGDKKIEQDFSLRRQQGSVEPLAGGQPGQVVGDQPLQQVTGLRPFQGDDGAV